MTDTAWHERRRKSGGASDLPIVLGCSPYADASPLVLAWQKRGLVPPTITAPTMDRWIASEYEAMGRRWLAHALGARVDYDPRRDDFVTWCTTCRQRCWHLGHPEIDWGMGPCCAACPTPAAHCHANLDGRVVYESRELVYEAKAITRGNPEYAAWRGNGVPESVVWQVQQQLLCTDLTAALIVVHDVSNADFSVRVIEADHYKQRFLEEVWRTWWQAAVVEVRDPATPWTASVQRAIRARWPDVEPDKVVELPASLIGIVDDWQTDKRLAREATKRVAEAKTRLLKHIENAAIGRLPDGTEIHRKITAANAVTLTVRKGAKT